MTAIQAILLIALAGAFALTWKRLRQGALSRRAALLWSALWSGAGVVVLRPEVASLFASVVGVGRGADAALYLGTLLIAYLLFRQFLRIDKLERDITKLVRRMALDEMERGKENLKLENLK